MSKHRNWFVVALSSNYRSNFHQHSDDCMLLQLGFGARKEVSNFTERGEL